MLNSYKICFLTILSIFLTGTTLFCQWRIPSDSIYQYIKTHSIYKSQVNWAHIDSRFENCMQAAIANEDIADCFVKVFGELNDASSSILYKNKKYAIKSNTCDTIDRLKSLHDRSVLEYGKITSSLIKGKYAYLRIPDLSIAENQKNIIAQSIADTISKYSNPEIEGFIIDLRLMTEGNLESILAGLHSLTGDGNLGGEIDENQKIIHNWDIESGNFSDQGILMTHIKKSSSDLNNIPVVILTGAITDNAGCKTAIAFKGRPKTYFIGESTPEGSALSKYRFQITDEFSLSLAEAFIIDRKKHIYPHFFPTDILVQGGDNFENLLEDFKIRTAIRWMDRKNLKPVPSTETTSGKKK